jgi:hypothetical protein
MYQVFDNGKPAQYPDHPVHPSRDNSTFETLREALVHAWKWLGPFGGSFDGSSGIPLQVGIPWDYSGHGDMIEIRKVK